MGIHEFTLIEIYSYTLDKKQDLNDKIHGLYAKLHDVMIQRDIHVRLVLLPGVGRRIKNQNVGERYTRLIEIFAYSEFLECEEFRDFIIGLSAIGNFDIKRTPQEGNLLINC